MTAGSDAIKRHREAATGATRPGTWTNRGIQFLDMISEPWIPGNWFDHSTGRFNNPAQAFGVSGIAQGAANGVRNMINRIRGVATGRQADATQQTVQPRPLPSDYPQDGNTRVDAMQSPAAAQFQGRQSRQGAGRGQVIAQRTGNARNDRALESMAEGLMGRSATQTLSRSAQQAREMQERMFGGKQQ
jgi:hypothetical protein